MTAKGSFEVLMSGEPPYEIVDGVSLSRVAFEKKFTGPLDATSKVTMIAARTKIENSAGYVAAERIIGTLEGKPGTFVLVHVGLMTRGSPSLQITVVPDSGTGELAGISGRMDIQIVDGNHFYELEYELGETTAAFG
jgi:hypothetical protein